MQVQERKAKRKKMPKDEVVPGIEPGLPECSEGASESGVITATLYNLTMGDDCS